MNARPIAVRIVGAAIVTVALWAVTALPILAEQASAESPDFTVNTVPEPAALVAVLGVLLLTRRLEAKRQIV